MSTGFKMGNPDCKCCSTTPTPSCSTTINVTLADIQGRTDKTAVFCPVPTKLNYSLSGNGVGYSGTVQVGGGPPYGFSVGFANLPKGNFSFRVFSDPDVCGSLRFDSTQQIASGCPDASQVNNLVVPAQYDLLDVYSTPWYVQACTDHSIAVTITASSSGGTVCSTTALSGPGAGAGGCHAVVKVPAYPVSVTFSATAPDCLGESQTYTYSSCSNVTDDWCGKAPRVCYTKWLCAAWCCTDPCNNQSYLPLPGATVKVSGGVTGQGQTTAAGYPHDLVTITDWVPPKCGVSQSQLEVFWTVTHPKCGGASYNDSQASSTDPNNHVYGGGYGMKCPIGGYAGGPDAGHACGGCPEPLSKSLHCSVLGTEIVLTHNGSNWVGEGVWTTMSQLCLPGQGCPGYGMGGVPFRVAWGGIPCPPQSGTPSIFFSAVMGFGVVSQCPVPNPGGNIWATGCGYYSQYKNSETESCSPLLSSGSCTATVTYYVRDDVNNNCVPVTYDADLSWTISE